MVLEFFHWFIIGFLLVLPILYELSSTFRYHAKFTLYYAFIMGIATVVCVYGLFKPGDVNNHWFILWSMKHVRKLFGIEIELRGQENLESDKPYILVINHQSSLDCFGMFEIWPKRGSALIKSDLKYAGPFGLAGLLCGATYIERFNHEKALETMQKTIKRINDKNIKLLVFPEGTRNHEGGMMPFKKGCFHLAVQAQIPVVPVVFSSYSEFYSKQDKKFSTGKFIATCLPPVSTKGLTANDVADPVENVQKQKFSKFIATCLPPVSTKGLTANDVADLAENVRKQMLDVFNQTSLENTQMKLASKVANGNK